MRNYLLIILLITSLSTMAQNGKATTEKKTFNRTTTIHQNIDADASVIWELLTNASGFSKWNSTIVSIDGTIQKGEKIKLKSTLDPKRTFKLKVAEMVTNKKMIWKGAMGNREYTLENAANGTTEFTMTEKIGGVMFPLFASKIPSFDKSFEEFTEDLKKEAEVITQSN